MLCTVAMYGVVVRYAYSFIFFGCVRESNNVVDQAAVVGSITTPMELPISQLVLDTFHVSHHFPDNRFAAIACVRSRQWHKS